MYMDISERATVSIAQSSTKWQKNGKRKIEKEVRDNSTIGPLDHNPNKIRRVADQGFKA